jgi:hypothetical protein
MIGTDYAHRVGDSPANAIQAVIDLGKEHNLPQEKVDLMLGKNAEGLFSLPSMLSYRQSSAGKVAS